MPVYYTHLDVYKRQVPAFEIANLFPLRGIFLNDFLHPFLFIQIKGEADNNKLDVYKRQSVDRMQ